MSLSVIDGRQGQRFVLRCDDCGAELVAADREAVTREVKRLGWTELGADLCPTCQTQRFERRFARYGV